ncbi:hypothetical protein jhhlp_000166 [Lomentospora prolificans]|uniref:Heterokaryon incompatibility domain-containing protein n=1 Tax=Lomentospora prolificans TaxID=41688 RepID=A0A2N3NLS2_9PEZI|nr:hypothetical protein jhhlp_000166 [Lomentospora prolificans]
MDLDPLNYSVLGPELIGKMFRILNLNRALSLHPGKDDSPVECDLVQTSLAESPQYAALSYCWDVPQPEHIVICNGRKLSIRHNLHTALLRNRHAENPVILWADAICINQDDLEERGRQVALMKDIFHGATEVIVWLGEEADDSALGMQAAQDLADAGREYLKQRDTLHDLPPDDPLVIATFKRFKRTSQWARFDAFSKIIDRNWFSRTWVVQEAAVAAKITIQCGDSTMTWEDFTHAAILQNQLDLYTSVHDRNVPPLMLIQTRDDYQNGVKRDLLSVMYRHRLFEATDPRDKIYGVAGMAGCSYSKIIMSQVDYTIDPFVLYRQVATELLKRGSDLSVLSLPRGLDKVHPPELPTWTPDWRVIRQSPVVGLKNQDDLYEVRYKASGDSQPAVQFDETGLLLGLECCWVDVVEAVGSPMVVDDIPHGYPGILRLPKVAYMLDEWREVAGTPLGLPYPTSEPALDAFIQTLVGGPPHLEMSFMRQQYDILDRQARLLRYMKRLDPILPQRAEKYVVPFLAKLLKVPKSSIAYPFGVSTCPLADRTVFRTTKGYIGLGNVRVAPGDRVAVPKGGKVPLVLRADGDKWKLQGECYLHGIMYGEAYDKSTLELLWIV